MHSNYEKKSIYAMETELSSLRGQEYSLRYNIYSDTFQSNQIQQNIHMQNQQIKDKHDELNRISEQIANAEHEKAQSESQLGGVQAKIDAYEQQQESLNKQRADIDKRLSEIRDKKWELGKIIMEGVPAPKFGYFCINNIPNCQNHPLELTPRQTNEAEIRAAEQNIENAKKQIEELEEQEKELYTQQADLTQELNDIYNKQVQEKALLYELESQISRLDFQIQQNKQCHEGCVRDLENLNSILENMYETYNTVQSNISNMEAELSNIQSKIAQLEVQIAKARAEQYRKQNAGYSPGFWPYISPNFNHRENSGNTNNQPDNANYGNSDPNPYYSNDNSDTRTTEEAARQAFDEMEKQNNENNNINNSEGNTLADAVRDAYGQAKDMYDQGGNFVNHVAQEVNHAWEVAREVARDIAITISDIYPSATGLLTKSIFYRIEKEFFDQDNRTHNLMIDLPNGHPLEHTR